MFGRRVDQSLESTAGSTTTIYNNGTSQNEWLPIPGNLPPPQEILDWATSGGGVVTFKAGRGRRCFAIFDDDDRPTIASFHPRVGSSQIF